MLVKIIGKTEWWSSPTLADIQHLSAKISIDTGELVMYDEVDELPEGVNTGSFPVSNVTVHGPVVKIAGDNSGYQRKYRKSMTDKGYRLLRVYVPTQDYEECYKFCKEMCDESI